MAQGQYIGVPYQEDKLLCLTEGCRLPQPALRQEVAQHMTRPAKGRQAGGYAEQAAIEAQAEGIDGNAPLLDLDNEDGDLLPQASLT